MRHRTTHHTPHLCLNFATLDNSHRTPKLRQMETLFTELVAARSVIFLKHSLVAHLILIIDFLFCWSWHAPHFALVMSSQSSVKILETNKKETLQQTDPTRQLKVKFGECILPTMEFGSSIELNHLLAGCSTQKIYLRPANQSRC